MIELVGFSHFDFDFLPIFGQGLKELFLFFDYLIGITKVATNFFGRMKEGLELVVKNFFQIRNAYFIPAFMAGSKYELAAISKKGTSECSGTISLTITPRFAASLIARKNLPSGIKYGVVR